MSHARKLLSLVVALALIILGVSVAQSAAAASPARLSSSSTSTSTPTPTPTPAVVKAKKLIATPTAKPQSLPTTGVISGKVVGSDTGTTGLENIDVTAYDSAGNYVDDDVTDSTGTYTISDLDPGNYTLQFQNEGDGSYVSQWWSGKTTQDTADAVSVSADGTSRANATLEVGATILGSVFGADTSAGVSGISVEAQGVGDNAGYDYEVTQDDGSYALENLPSGTYEIHFDTYSTAYISQWYGGGFTQSSATSVTVSDGTTTTLSTTTLVVGGEISGTITGTGGAAISGNDVFVEVLDSNDSYVPASYTTNDDGSYSIEGLPTGSYRLDVAYFGSDNYIETWWNGKTSYAAATPIPVTESETKTVNPVLLPGATVTGTVTDATSGQGISGVNVAACVNDYNCGTSGTVTTDASGDYTLYGFTTGKVSVSFSDPTGAHAYQYWNNESRASEATGASVTAGSTTANINAVLASDASISGTVSDATSHSKLSDITVEVYDADKAEVGTATTAGNGSYTVRGLPAGTYTVEFNGVDASDGTHALQWWSNSGTRSAGSPITLSTGQSLLNINAALGESQGVVGTVTDATTHNGLSDIWVTAYDADGPVASASTDLQGAYSIPGLAAGGYTVQFNDVSTGLSARAYQWWNDKTTQSSADTLTLSGGTSGTANAALPVGGVIAGSVSDIPTDANVDLDLYDSSGALASSTSTSSDTGAGGYSFTGLPAGTYRLELIDESNTDPAQWYDSGSSLASATVISVTAATTTTINPVMSSKVITAPVPTITGGAVFGQTLKVVAGTWSPSGVSLHYQWLRDGAAIAEATSSSYTVSASDIGHQLSVTVTGTKSGYAAVSQTSVQTSTAIAASLSAGTPTITGTGAVGQPLTVSPGTWTPSPVALTYQWSNSATGEIANATAATYTPAASDQGDTLTVTVQGTKTGYSAINATSDPTSVIAAAPAGKSLTKTPVPKISGSALVGSTLTASVGTWAPTPLDLHYQWNSDGSPIAGATKVTYVPVTEDGGASLTFSVTGSKSGYNVITETSAAVTIPLQLTSTPVPQVSGTVEAGSQLTATAGDWEPNTVVLSYQWKRSGVAISHATTAEYALASSDAGKPITVTVTGTLPGYQTVSKTSAAITLPKTLTAAPTPKITGSALVGSTLTASAGTWSPSKVTLAYQWNSNGNPISGATTSKYKPVTADGGATITVTVTGSKSGYASISRTSAGKAIPLQFAAPVPSETGVASVGQQLTGSAGVWAPNTAVLTYQWKRSGVAISHATTLDYTLVAADAGHAITLTVTGTLAGYQTLALTTVPVTPPKLLTKSPTPTISGSTTVGSTLTASAGTWAPSTVTLAYQWYSNGSLILGATSSKYVVTAGDEGYTLTVTVTGSKSGYASISRTSAGKGIPT